MKDKNLTRQDIFAQYNSLQNSHNFIALREILKDAFCFLDLQLCVLYVYAQWLL